jgi:iron complex transport system permease protein
LQPMTARRVLGICGLLTAVLFGVVVISLRLGAYPISYRDIVMTLVHGALGQRSQIPSDDWLIVFGLRLPRIALGILVGASLSVAGASFQALLRNPLADPYVLGVSSGAALGAILSLLLAGIITASFLSAVIMFLMTTLAGHDLRGMAFWLMGDLATTSNVPLGSIFLIMAVTIAAIYTTTPDLNLIMTGEEEARHLGVNVGRVKVVVYIAASLLTGLAVSVSGAIGYVGLLVPHLIRMMFGSDYRLLIPATALGGAIVIVAADTLGRTVAAPTELPVGAMTAVAGAPVFIYLLRRGMR